ncbi:hypothetical protein BC831DRAFT_506465, partial [Entophlyctis helioformis]
MKCALTWMARGLACHPRPGEHPVRRRTCRHSQMVQTRNARCAKVQAADPSSHVPSHVICIVSGNNPTIVFAEPKQRKQPQTYRGREMDWIPLQRLGAKMQSAVSLSDVGVTHAQTRRILLNMRPPASMFDSSGLPVQPPFPSNRIRTSKYTTVTFIPRNLFEQFRRFANIFFLTLAILQFFPTYQSINPWVAALPLILIIFATSVKDALEDYRRHVSDQEINSSKTRRLNQWHNTNQPFFAPAASPFLLARRAYRYLKLSLMGNRSSSSSQSAINDGRPSAGQVDPTALGTARPQSASSAQDVGRLGSADNDWTDVEWEDVQVGDIVLIRDNEQIPGDLVVLATSEPDGLCFIETKNLDGETNLKIRKSIDDRLPASTPRELKALRCTIDCEQPHPSIYSFTGTMVWYNAANSNHDGERTPGTPPSQDRKKANTPRSGSLRRVAPSPGSPSFAPQPPTSSSHENFPSPTASDHGDAGVTRMAIGINSVLLRGCTLRNTGWLYGIVVYTGSETKIQLNSGETPLKRSLIEIQTNFYMQVSSGCDLLFLPHPTTHIYLKPICIVAVSSLMSLITMVVFSLIVAITDITIEQNASAVGAPWLDYTFSGKTIGVAEGVSMFWVAIILYQNLVPISLYITVEIVKSIQSYLIFEDLEMYDPTVNQNCYPRSWNLADDLGQIEYVFSDKTGTLTRNIMEFKRCSINGVVYGSHEHRMSVESVATSIPMDHHGVADDGRRPFFDRQLARDLSSSRAKPDAPHFRCLFEFFSCLSLCHTVLVSKPLNQPPAEESKAEGAGIGSGNARGIIYKAQSPDEAALVDAARDIGFVFKSRDNTQVCVDMLGTPQTFQVLHVLEFSSSRKRMSVILRYANGDLILFCKGADTVIYERLHEGQDEMKTKTLADLEMFAEEGLRTLCLASVKLNEAQYREWSKVYLQATIALADREARIEQAAELIEQNLQLLGATAIEDKLQDGVPECIAVLLTAGLKVWVLTGDKMETAINIGYSCNLLTKDMTLILIRGGNNKDDEGSTLKQMEEALESFFGKQSLQGQEFAPANDGQGQPAADGARPSTGADHSCLHAAHQSRRFALVIDGRALFHALEENARGVFVELSTQCAAVICCRVSPLQKAKVVQLIKESQDAMCLAIGDGANDVSMIQAAHVGVGISGEEGLQAAMAADYVISQFRFLERLLLVHGRWCYVRTARMILNFFYKNIIYIMPLFFFQLYCGFSAEPSFDSSYMILVNILFTAVPVGVLGAFEKDVSSDMMRMYPQLYAMGINRAILTHLRTGLYALEGVYQAGVIMVMHTVFVQDMILFSNGHGEDYTYISLATSIATLSIANFYVAFSITSWSWIPTCAIFGSNLLVFGFLVIAGAIPGSNIKNYATIVYTCPTFWLAYILGVVLCFLPRFAFHAFSRIYTPTDVEIVQEIEKTTKPSKERSTSTWLRWEELRDASNLPAYSGTAVVPRPHCPEKKKRCSFKHLASVAIAGWRHPVASQIGHQHAFAQAVHSTVNR